MGIRRANINDFKTVYKLFYQTNSQCSLIVVTSSEDDLYNGGEI